MKMRVTIDDQSFEVEVGDLKARPIPVMVDGKTFMIMPEEQSQAASPANGSGAAHAPVVPAKAATAASAAAGAKAVTAPMPGVIISVAAKVGDSISVGQELCVLEAMKMKNSIRANRAGKIAVVCVAAGDQAVRGTVLMEFGD